MERIEMFMDNQISQHGLVLLMQDLADCEVFDLLPDSFANAAAHCANQGLITLPGRYLQ